MLSWEVPTYLLQCYSGCICEPVWGWDLHLSHCTGSRVERSPACGWASTISQGPGENKELPASGERSAAGKLHLRSCASLVLQPHQLCGAPAFTPGSVHLADCELASFHNHVSQFFMSFFLCPEACWFCFILDILFLISDPQTHRGEYFILEPVSWDADLKSTSIQNRTSKRGEG